jgi:hypothetical protein
LEPIVWRSFYIASVVLLAAAGAHAQEAVSLIRERGPADRPTLMIVGTGHFANPGRDIKNQQIDDVLAAKRQAEIAVLVQQLAAFKPTYVVVEWPADRQPALDARYKAYREGSYTLTRNEIDQLGLRLAAQLNLSRVIAADWNAQSPGDEAAYDWYEYGKAHGQSGLVAAIVDPGRILGDVPLTNQSLGQWVKALNDPSALASSHRNYFDIAMVGDPSAQPGASWVGHWYARNLRIFANLENLHAQKNDRILVLYGAGHAHLLSQFSRESGAFTVVPASEVLK